MPKAFQSAARDLTVIANNQITGCAQPASNLFVPAALASSVFARRRKLTSLSNCKGYR
jgi:hypothetical protein